MNRILLFFLSLLCGAVGTASLWGQSVAPKVGVNHNTPTQTLDVNGKVRVVPPLLETTVGQKLVGVKSGAGVPLGEQGLIVQKAEPVKTRITQLLFRVQNQVDPVTNIVHIDDEITDANLNISADEYDVIVLSALFTNTKDWKDFEENRILPRVPCHHVAWTSGRAKEPGASDMKEPADPRDLYGLFFDPNQRKADAGFVGYMNTRAHKQPLMPITERSDAAYVSPIVEVYIKNKMWHLQADHLGRPFFPNYTQTKSAKDAYRRIDKKNPILRGTDEIQGLWVLNVLLLEKDSSTPKSEIVVPNFDKTGSAGKVLP